MDNTIFTILQIILDFIKSGMNLIDKIKKGEVDPQKIDLDALRAQVKQIEDLPTSSKFE